MEPEKEKTGNAKYGVVILGLMIVAAAGYIWLKKPNEHQNQLPAPTVQPSEAMGDAIPEYKQAEVCAGTECGPELSADLTGTGDKVTVRFYEQGNNIEGCPILPVVVRVFSNENGKAEDKYTNTLGDDNEFVNARVIPSLWGEGPSTVAIETYMTGCGSGYTAHLNFLRAGSTEGTTSGMTGYFITPGPQFGELDAYWIDPKNSRILLARAVWGGDESHFENHQYQLESYVWNETGGKFEKTVLAKTKNKYAPVYSRGPEAGQYPSLISEILAKEPGIIKL